MSVFDALKGILGMGGGQAEAQQANSMFGVLEGLLGKSGGLSGLIQKFVSAGLKQQVESWIGLGKNQEISGSQLEQALGSEQIASLAERMGLDKEQAKSKLAELLPKVIDKLTPTGQVPEEGGVMSALGSLRNLLGGGTGAGQ